MAAPSVALGILLTFTYVDLFAGCGGLSRGLEWAGFDCIAFNELNKDAGASFKANFPDAAPFIGDIAEVFSNDIINENGMMLKDIDLVCGGPPCQGFSGIGHRRAYTSVEKKDITTNHLFNEMIRVIDNIQPKTFLFENVQGLLSSRWNSSGAKGDIFRDVLHAFSSLEGYTVQPTLQHAYDFGVPQNRPRVFIMGIRNDILNNTELEPTQFDLVLDSSKFPSMLRRNGGFFADMPRRPYPSIIEAISDLAYDDWEDGQTYRHGPDSDYQRLMREGIGEPWHRKKLTDHHVSKHTKKVKKRFKWMIDHGVSRLADLPEEMQTNKFSQKVLPEEWGDDPPSITCLSNSDDYIHYSQPRALSVREWARLQSFPDIHQFRGPRTTGGARRAGDPTKPGSREVPKYTQIGNAVPPLVGKALGSRIKNILLGK